jgi:hypothetical protein
MRMKEQLALAEIERAQIALSEAYKTIGGAENKRDRLKAFVSSIFTAMAELADHAGADAAYVLYGLPASLQDIDVAFEDVVEAEDAAEPRIDPVRELGTYNVMNGRVA